ncbi:Oxysterol-binding protein-related protein 6 [Porphyridium purpureum]|uniref:Oxysterol-binding protein-related protein 6 n=1 Tax=Porphyridium purpureum TaxID=35688 RepID=A0A5J4ZA27_PORPP|nr:Oxysterol-binding protein-related protein 6 [Porphyridium purpureum]|eukprot:POR9387..scf295_1
MSGKEGKSTILNALAKKVRSKSRGNLEFDEILAQAVAGNAAGAASAPASAPSNGAQLAVRTSAVVRASIRSGELLKYVNLMKGWQKRFFKLESGILNYYMYVKNVRERESNEKRSAESALGASNASVLSSGVIAQPPRLKYHGSINLQFAVIAADDADECKFAIDCGTQIVHLKAETQLERDAWVHDLQAAKKFHEEIVTRAERRTTLGKDQVRQLVREIDSVGVGGLEERSRSIRAPDFSGQVEEDDGFREAWKNHEMLIVELQRMSASMKALEEKGVLQDRQQIVMNLQSIFAPESLGEKPSDNSFEASPEGKVVNGLSDLVEWSLNVLKTEELLWLMKSKHEMAALGAPVKTSRADKAARKRSSLRRPPSSAASAASGPSLLATAATVLPSVAVSSTRSDFQAQDAASGDDLGHKQSVNSEASAFAPVNSISSESDDDEFYDISTIKQRQFADRADSDMADTSSQGGIFVQVEPTMTVRRVDTMALPVAGEFRSMIPKPKHEMKKISVWGVLKDAVGKDLSKIAVPVVFNEPLSFLQRMTEDVEYSDLLDAAVKSNDPRERLLLVAALGLSHYSSTMERLGKPFNPLLGETFELVSKARHIRVIAEQVSHHPPVSCIHVEGAGGAWTYRSNIEVKNKFWGKSLEVFPTGWNHVEFRDHDEHFTYFQPITCVHNIMVGNLWVDNYGDVLVKEHKSGMQVLVSLYKSGWMSDKKLYASLKGEVTDKNGVKMDARIFGNWDKKMSIEIDGKKRKVWESNSRPPADHSAGFNMTQWAISLNSEVPENERDTHAPTDSRFRPDQRYLEKLMIDEATNEKLRLEQKQRTRRKLYEEKGIEHIPRWFVKRHDPIVGSEDWVCTNEYWKCKEARNWHGCLDIFSPSPP